MNQIKHKLLVLAMAVIPLCLFATGESQAQHSGVQPPTTVHENLSLVADVVDSESLLAPKRLVFTVDIAEDFTTFVPTLVNPADPEPGRGSFFVTEGHIYPAGTIQGDGSDFDPTQEGSIGNWFCRGTHLVTASEIPDAPYWVDTIQLYYFPDDGQSISTDGLEGSGIIQRSVIGGTGSFAGYTGEQIQEFLGFHTTGGVNLRVTFVLRKVTRP